MLKKILNKKNLTHALNRQEKDVALRLIFELAISDGNLDKNELKILKSRAKKLISGKEDIDSVIKHIIDEREKATSLYPTIQKINDAYTFEKKIDLLEVLWSVVTADELINHYEENLYFKIANLIKVKRSKANQIKQENS
jgi:uncharacterized tellurite resistance protein B-like protein|tara:strand:+ start:500 stop:919 length:420 start_codon:yes stop_codon:yes gene_type:complete